MSETGTELWSFVRRRGFLWGAAEIYGGLGGFYDYATNGALLKKRFEDFWLDYFLGLHENYHLIDTVNILPERCFEGSGHLEHFVDVALECAQCRAGYRTEELLGEDLRLEEARERIVERAARCPSCGSRGFEVRELNTMFPVMVGRAERAYLRPETAQGAYLNFKRLFKVCRETLPLGLAIIGKAYRNEISPRQGVYRLREFSQAELQIFFDPESAGSFVDLAKVASYSVRVKLVGSADAEFVPCKELAREYPDFYVYHLAKTQQFYELLQVPPEKFRLAEKSARERAFYNKIHFDVEIYMESLEGFKEVAGVHYRTDYDLSRHQQYSKQELAVTLASGKKLIPHVVELSFGVDRNVWALIDLFYDAKSERKVFRVVPRLAPKLVGIFPLLRKADFCEKARAVYEELRKSFGLACFYDERGSIGRRYARADELGTPYCVTIDHQTLEDDTVTIRLRDSTRQKRFPVARLREVLVGLAEANVTQKFYP